MKSKITFYILCVLILVFCTVKESRSDNPSKYINSNFGTDFWFTIPPALIENGNINTNFVRIFITSEYTTIANVKVAGKGFSKTVEVLPGTASEVSLEPSLAQPYIKTALDPISPSDIYKNSAIHITTDYPVSVNVLISYSSTSEGFTALPSSLAGKEYIISSYGDASIYYPPYKGFPSLAGIVAIHDGTEVNFKLGGNLSTKTSSGQVPGSIVKKILNKGDVWMISSDGRDADLSGSKITTSMPVSVVSASYSANVPSKNKYSGYIAEMEIPTQFWGRTFHIPVIQGRKLSPIIRVYAKEANTTINLNGSYYATINESGGLFNSGYIELRINDLNGSNSGTISSDKPISVTMYNTGVEEDGLPVPQGSPFQIQLNPIENYTNDLIVSMPAIGVDKGYESNYMSIIYKRLSDGSIPDDLVLGKYSINQFNFVPVKNMILLQNQVIDLVNNYGLITVKLDPKGSYRLKSNNSFAAYVYGFNNEGAFGFSAGLRAKLSETNDNSAPSVSWNVDCIGNVAGNTRDLPDDNNRSNLAGALFLSDESNNFSKGNFDIIVPGSTSNIKWELKVINPDYDAKAILVFWDLAGNYTRSEINYKAVNNSIDKTYESFGSFRSGTSAVEKKFLITNKSDTNSAINSIKLMHGNTGFSLVKLPKLPILLAKGEILEITVRFEPGVDSGVFTDSIGFGDACKFAYRTHIEAVIGNPVIEVSDISFGDLTVGGISTQKSYIRNNGVSDLMIKSMRSTRSIDFEVVFDQDFDIDKPLIVPSDGMVSFEVIFRPTEVSSYQDSVIIFSDATTSDNICVINARGIEPGLVASSYNWDRKRIFRTIYPAGPYPIDNSNQSITLENTGSTEILIKGIEIIDEINSEAFEFNRQVFNNLKLKAGEKFDFKVQFRPVKTGNHYLKIKYITDFKGSATVTELNGFGTVPKLNSHIVEFDTTIVDNYYSPSIRKIAITNLGTDTWEFSDTLYIYDFRIPQNEEISNVWANYGTKGFKIDKEAISFPIKLAPGKTFLLYSGFVAQYEGKSLSEIEIISDGLDTAKIALKGFGIEQQISFVGGEVESCIGFSNVINGYIKNNSELDIKFTDLVFDKYESEFRLLNPEIASGFSLAPGEQISIAIEYTPKDLTNKKVEVILTDSRSPLLKKYATFSGRAIQFVTNIYSSPTLTKVNIADTITQKIVFRSESDLSAYDLNNFELIVSYNDNILSFLEGSAIISNQLNGSFTLSKDIDFKEKGKLKFFLKALAESKITKDVDLCDISFVAYYPNDDIDYCDIKFVVQPVEKPCIIVDGSTSRVHINPVCGSDLRVIDFSSVKYHLQSIYPNPVTSNIATINFSIGISGFTELTVYNSNGIVISKPVSENLKSGKYECTILLDNLSSGIYFYVIKSGPFFETKKFVVAE